MARLADDWQKTLLNGVAASAILFLALLPYFGRAWHRVLPEHNHLFIGTTDSFQLDIFSGSRNENDQDAQFDAGDPNAAAIHLPDPTGALQIFTIAIVLTALLFIFVPTGFASRIVSFSIFYNPASISPPDPPPTSN